MIKTLTAIKITESLCQRCYECVRKCPAKAIKITELDLAISSDRCIACGACTLTCAKGVFSSENSAGQIRDLLASKPVVAVLAPEIDAVFPGINRAQLVSALKDLGFFTVEELVIAEEMVALAYTELLSRDRNGPIIRSTCPAVVNYIEIFHPDMIENLAPIASPMIVQGRLVKKLYDKEPAVVFIGPCIAKKAEIEKDDSGAIDYILTFDQMMDMLREASIDPAAYPSEEDERLVLNRSFSTPGGFPISLLKDSKIDDLLISRSVVATEQLLSESDDHLHDRVFLDLLSCRGCIDGPAFGRGNRLSRMTALGDQQVRPQVKTVFNDLAPLPDLDLTQNFSSRPLSEKILTFDDLEKEMSEAGLSDDLRHLNCGLCGYETCAGQARAVIAGQSDWSACFPNQRQIAEETIIRLKEVTNTDGLTDLVNHRGFIESLSNEYHRFVRYKKDLSIIMIDVDGFKQINDTHGHVQGDRVLKLLAQILIQNIRETDITARYGGDEFAIILPEISKDEAVVVAEKLRAKASDALFWLGGDIKERVTLSLGVCSASESDADPVSFLNRADKALYKAKRAGRNQTVIGD